MSVSDNGQPVAILFERAPSPDLVTAFKDPAASNQRFELQAFCGGGCILRVATDGGPVIEKPFADIVPGSIPIGGGSIFFDVAGSELSPMYQPDRVNRISYRLREIVMRSFDFIRIPLLIVGLVAAFGCLRYWRDALRHPAYVLGIAMWALAASRIFIIALLDATFVTTINPVYLGPTGFVLDRRGGVVDRGLDRASPRRRADGGGYRSGCLEIAPQIGRRLFGAPLEAERRNELSVLVHQIDNGGVVHRVVAIL